MSAPRISPARLMSMLAVVQGATVGEELRRYQTFDPRGMNEVLEVAAALPVEPIPGQCACGRTISRNKTQCLACKEQTKCPPDDRALMATEVMGWPS